jgi:hypothetical protein
MKLHNLLIALSVVVSSLAPSASAMDRLSLKNGEVIEGKLLSTVPDRYYDFQDVDGNKKRFRMFQVKRLDLNLTSDLDHEINSNTADLFISGNIGGFMDNRGSNTLHLNWGGRIGVNSNNLGIFGKLSYAVSYHHLSFQPSPTALKYTIGELMFQVLIRNIFDSGIYLGPEGGIGLISSPVSGSVSTSRFDYGALIGFDYHFNYSLSAGPEVHYTAMNFLTIYKFLLGVTVHI